MKLILVLVVVLAGAACNGCTHNPPPTPTPVTAVDAGDLSCAALCEHRSRLGCRTAEPTPGGFTCIDVCANANDPAGPIQWDMGCRVTTTSCDAEARCQ